MRSTNQIHGELDHSWEMIELNITYEVWIIVHLIKDVSGMS